MLNIPEGATHMSDELPYRKDGSHWYYWNSTYEKWGPSQNSEEWVAENVRPLQDSTQLHDAVNNPKHYQLLPGVEVYDIRQALAAKATAAGATLDQFSDYDRAVEYLLRMWEKNGVEDAKKAAWYLNKLVEKLSDDRS